MRREAPCFLAGSGNPSRLGEVAGPCGRQGGSRGRLAVSVCEELGGFWMACGSATSGPGTLEGGVSVWPFVRLVFGAGA